MSEAINNTFTMYIAAHKSFDVPIIGGYVPIEVGAALRSDHLGYQRDDEGENISQKNPSYCELTAHYWMWKHAACKSIGLCHYRRYFSSKPYTPDSKYYLTANRVARKLKKYDIILPEPVYWENDDVAGQYIKTSGKKSDIEMAEEVLRRVSPRSIGSYQRIMNGHTASYFNMLICNKELFDDYSDWLFTELFELEKHLDLYGRSRYESRVFGFLAERLINVWADYKQLKVGYASVINTDINISELTTRQRIHDALPGAYGLVKKMVARHR